MKKSIIIILLFISLFIILPNNTSAISENYKDVVSTFVEQTPEENKISLYLFYGEECPHCEKEREFLKSIENKYHDYLDIHLYEVWHNKTNSTFLTNILENLNIKASGVPITFIGEKYYIGYSTIVGEKLENDIKEYANLNSNEENINLPILGEVNMKKVSIPLVAIILGLIDGFNPCAMWILLFLINMLFNMKNRRRMWILGITFLIISGLVYFISLLGISIALNMSSIVIIRKIIAGIAIALGLFNLYKYFQTKNSTGCDVIDDKKRKKTFNKIKDIINQKTFILALVGIITLAISVNLIELACSLGFPMIFTEILALNDIHGFTRIIYLLLYILLYMLDDIIIFIISMLSLKLSGISTKYTKYSHLIGGILMLLMGLLLVFKPEWLMFNFN